jgi:hypothetical protein
MRRHHFHRLVINVAGVVFWLGAYAVQAEGEHPHAISKSSKAMECTTCHKTTPVVNQDSLLESKNKLVKQDDFKQDGTAMCSACHDPNDGHKVGLELDFQAPADLPLGEKNTITCLTCHYSHGSLTSDRPQASFSFLDRLFDDERLHKSFLLRRNNSDGELCLTCHSVSQGS